MLSDAYLILENGAIFKGRSFGYDAEAIGELVFTTGMTGYLETLADPLYFGQIVLQTFPLIGNYGVIPSDFGSGPAHLKAYIVRDWCKEPSNFRSEGNLDSFLREKMIPGLYGIDTRALTHVIRENGVMNAMISKSPELSDEGWDRLRAYKITDAVSQCAMRNAECRINSAFRVTKTTLKIVVWDFGDGHQLVRKLQALGCEAVIAGHDTTADDVMAYDPDGVLLSGGPGDPSENTSIIGEIKKMSNTDIPILAVGLGHQMLALAHGAETVKLLFGHHGSNQPVSECGTKRVFVTKQNHGYAVSTDSLPDGAVISYVNSGDGTCEGIEYADNGVPAFSVQFDPTDEVFDKFLTQISVHNERTEPYAAE